MRLGGWALLVSFMVTDAAAAEDALGVYVTAGAGRAGVQADPGPGGILTGFDEHDTGWTVSLGVRPVSYFGGELQYFDFGHLNPTISVERVDVQERAAALFGVGYLPVPVARLELYAKAGVGRLHATAAHRALVPIFCPATYIEPHCADERADVTETRFGWGAGALLKLSSSLSARAEYARFSAPTGDPDLLSLSLTWTF